MPIVITAVIPPRATMSDAVLLTDVTAVVGLIMPGDWTPAVVTVQGSPFGVNFYDIYDGTAGKELLFNVKPRTLVMINPNRLRSCIAIKLRSGTAAAPVAQLGARTFGIVVEGGEQLYPTPWDEEDNPA